MSLRSRLHVAIFVIIVRSTAYLVSAFCSALFIVSLPMDQDGVVDALYIDGDDDQGIPPGWLPTEFKNSFERLRYYHNVEMMDRNRKFLYAQLTFGALFGALAFSVTITPRGQNLVKPQEDGMDASERIICGAVLGAVTTLILPLLLGWILPAPIRWLPSDFAAISELRMQEALSRLELEAAMMGF